MLIAGVIAGIEEKRRGRRRRTRPTRAVDRMAHRRAGRLRRDRRACRRWRWAGACGIRATCPIVADIGTLLAHRAVGDYTLSMSHFFDLTGPSFAALRLPAVHGRRRAAHRPRRRLVVAAQRQASGRHHQHRPHRDGIPHRRAHRLRALLAHARLQAVCRHHHAKGSPSDTFIIYGEQSSGSSVIFYTHNFFRQTPAGSSFPRCGQHGEGSTLLWGSCYPDAPNIFISEDQLSKEWGTGERKWLFAQDMNQPKAESLLAGRLYLVQSLPTKHCGPIARSNRPLPRLCRVNRVFRGSVAANTAPESAMALQPKSS